MSRSFSRTWSLSSSVSSDWGAAWGAGQQADGMEDLYDVQLGNDMAPLSAVACCGLVDDEYLLTVRELVEQVVAQQRDPRTTAVWMKGMDKWVTLEELMTDDSAARQCCRRCN